MSNTSSITYGRVAVVLQEIGMVSQEKAQTVLAEYADVAHSELKPYDVACALEMFGTAVSVHADDIDYLEDGYGGLLDRAAALTDGAVTVTNVRLHEGEFIGESRDDVLEFERNGQPVSISAEHFSDEYYDQMAACEAIEKLAPDNDPRSFLLVDFEREKYRVYDSIMVLTTSEQAAALEKSLGLRIR
ncbi:hypothetical protein [Saccharopolyspora sp. 5N708]|uniref:hypothetical protein n=1 Tax=Saccharopolyspora sp. 5N708 TaxID=3457424 RepID=UPI003FD4A7F8